MPWWLLLIELTLVWMLGICAELAQRRKMEAGLGISPERRKGVEILPMIPFYPLAFWGVAALIDRWNAPWGTLGVAALHAVLAFVFGIWIAWNWRSVRQLDRKLSDQAAKH